jgi:hypothetical protein
MAKYWGPGSFREAVSGIFDVASIFQPLPFYASFKYISREIGVWMASHILCS